MDGVIGDGAADDIGPSFGVIHGASHHRDSDCDVDWCIDGIFVDCCCWYYYYYYFIIILLLLDSICIG